ncbi:cytochrome c4 [Sphingomicrobium clamense]|uniref:Cytochrome c n=1 Tax=Sphingomicrobium clamense TaxID=2851013 RepID=A0ABS6V536_9SPHN|nr:cytochrome c [Sphingomicrobium sp. B8]MBW0144672.1 cytochrome c [Sphingomicrobium sp. B8]
MRKVALLLACASLFACSSESNEPTETTEAVRPAAVTFDGADYGDDEAAKIAHGDRLASVLLCRGCHMPDLTGTDMGKYDPELSGVIASNLTRAVPELDDRALHMVLRKGTHPKRDDFWMMPSKIYQHVSDADMQALMAYLRTLEPAGEELPLTQLNEGLRAAHEAGEFPTVAEEVALHRETQPRDLGATHRLGRYVATTVCADCHGPALEGSGDFAPNLIDMAPMYGEEGLNALLTTGAGLDGRELDLMAFVGAELTSKMTDNERAALVAYLLSLSEAQMAEGPQ